MKKLALLLTLLVLAAVGLAACGGDDDDETSAAPATDTSATDTTASGGGAAISVSADPGGQLAYTETELTAAAGDDTIEFDNPASIPHDVRIEDADGNDIGGTDVVSGDSATASVTLEPGTYTFFCSVDGHRDAGMEGTLTVN